MNDDPKDDYPTRTEKENMDAPQEEFISSEPPSATRASHPNSEKDPDDGKTFASKPTEAFQEKTGRGPKE